MLNEIIYSLYQSGETTKKCTITESNYYKYKMDTIFMNSENGKNSKSYILILKLTQKTDLRRSEISVAFSNLSIYYTWKNIKAHAIIINLKYLVQHGMKNSNYQMDHT